VLSVKIENTPQVRPQAHAGGRHRVERGGQGGITRFLAMFQSQSADVVGPIRSVRLTDPSIVWPSEDLRAYRGGAPNAVRAIGQAPVTLVDENTAGGAMFRDRSRASRTTCSADPRALGVRRRTGSTATPVHLHAAAEGPNAAATPRPPSRSGTAGTTP
jgi:hypothetical protein